MFKRFNEELINRDDERIFSYKLWQTALHYVLDTDERPLNEPLTKLRQLHHRLVTLSKDCDDNGVIFSLHAHLWGGVYPILKFASEAIKKRYLPELIDKDAAKISCLVYTDCKENPLICRMRTDGHYVLTGKKKFITNSPVADFFIVYSKTDDMKMNVFVVDKNSPGLIVKEDLKLTGLRTSTIANIDFQNCIVSAKNMIGNPGMGALIFNACIEKERLFIMSSILGRFYKLKNEYIKLAKEHKVLDYYPNIETLTLIQNSILITSRILEGALDSIDKGESIFLVSAQAKTIIVPLYQEACRRIIQSLGALGLEQALGFERENRDALGASIYSGSHEVLNRLIVTCSKY